MPYRIDRTHAGDAADLAVLVGELLREIMDAIGSNVFAYDWTGTENRARAWLTDGRYTVFLAP